MDGTLCAEPHPRGVFPLNNVTIVHLEKLALDQDVAASLIQATVRGVLCRLNRDYTYDSIVLVQKFARGYCTRQKIKRGHRERARISKIEIENIIQTASPESVLESVLLRMGMCFTKRSTMHKKLCARNQGFTYALGERPSRHHPKFNHIGHVHYAPKYQHLRQFLINEDMSVLQFLRMITRETTGHEASVRSLIKQHEWDRDGYMLYEDVYKAIEHIIRGNTDGGVISRNEMSEQIFPLLDMKGSGKILVDDFIALIYQHEIKISTNPMLATIAYGSSKRPKPKIDTRYASKITKSAAHRANVLWTAQQVDIDSLELSKIYGSDKFDTEEERLLCKYVLDHYATGLTYREFFFFLKM